MKEGREEGREEGRREGGKEEGETEGGREGGMEVIRLQDNTQVISTLNWNTSRSEVIVL